MLKAQTLTYTPLVACIFSPFGYKKNQKIVQKGLKNHENNFICQNAHTV